MAKPKRPPKGLRPPATGQGIKASRGGGPVKPKKKEKGMPGRKRKTTTTTRTTRKSRPRRRSTDMSRNLKLKKTTTKRTSYGIDGSAAKKAANKAASIAKNHIKKRGRTGKSIVKTIFSGYKAP